MGFGVSSGVGAGCCEGMIVPMGMAVDDIYFLHSTCSDVGQMLTSR